MDVQSELQSLSSEGFATLKKPFDDMFTDAVRERTLEIMENPISYRELLEKNGKEPYYDVPIHISPLKKIQGSFLGKDPLLDQFAKKLFEDTRFLELVRAVAGVGYKINTFSLRQASSLTKVDGLHQDGPAQVSFAFLMNDISSSMPTTFFVSGSHRFPKNIFDRMESLPLALYRSLLNPCVGSAGDVCLFFNKTWHGMKPGQGTSTVLMIAFDPVGYEHAPKILPEKTNYGVSFREAVGDKIYSCLNPSEGLVEKDGRYLVCHEESPSDRLVDYCLNNPVTTSRSRMVSLYLQTLGGLFHSARAVKKKLVA